MKSVKRIVLFLTFITLVISFITIRYITHAKETSDLVIYLDPGHGGFDGGATSKDMSVVEKDINLACAIYLKSYLEKTGFIVKLTRSKDIALAKNKKDDIYKRVDLINKSKAFIYISIHTNSFPNASVKGAQTFYSTNFTQNMLLATKVMEQLNYLDKENKRVSKSINGKYLLTNIVKPGCLVELGFLTNERDLSNLTSDTYLAKIAFYIYLGILSYIEESRHL